MLSYKYKVIRSSAVLTTSYVAGTVIGPNDGAIDFNQALLLIEFIIGSLSSAQVKIEFSIDGTTYGQESFVSLSGGTSSESLGIHNYTASGNYWIEKPIKYPYIKVSVQGTGTVTNSLMAITAFLGNV